MKLPARVTELRYKWKKPERRHATLMGHSYELFAQLQIDCVLDVGANVGKFGKKLRKYGYRGRILSFEPVRAPFERLSQAVQADPLWDAHNFALGSEAGPATVNVLQSSEMSSLRAPNDYLRGRFGRAGEISAREEVEVRCLDELLPQLRVGETPPRIFLKLDTKGFDLEVIKGGRQVLGHVFALQSEISVIPIYEDMPDYISALDSYRSLGYNLTAIYPVSRDQSTLQVIEFDCVMTRERATL